MLSISLSPLRLVAFSTRVKVNGTCVGRTGVVGSTWNNEYLISGSPGTERSVGGVVAVYSSEAGHAASERSKGCATEGSDSKAGSASAERLELSDLEAMCCAASDGWVGGSVMASDSVALGSVASERWLGVSAVAKGSAYAEEKKTKSKITLRIQRNSEFDAQSNRCNSNDFHNLPIKVSSWVDTSYSKQVTSPSGTTSTIVFMLGNHSQLMLE